jgi:hypothetical protein
MNDCLMGRSTRRAVLSQMATRIAEPGNETSMNAFAKLLTGACAVAALALPMTAAAAPHGGGGGGGPFGGGYGAHYGGFRGGSARGYGFRGGPGYRGGYGWRGGYGGYYGGWWGPAVYGVPWGYDDYYDEGPVVEEAPPPPRVEYEQAPAPLAYEYVAPRHRPTHVVYHHAVRHAVHHTLSCVTPRHA